MQSPNDYPRRVLVAACGMTPQVVTETLYALRVSAEQPFLVNEIRLITTSKGRQQAELSLLRDRQFERLCTDYGIEGIRFGADDIKVMRNERGEEMDDIRTPGDNAAAADCIAEELRALTDDPQTAVHVSLAGGRKTMGYYIGYVLSFYGRAQDRLSHVLVTDGFEAHPEFFYPTPDSRIITTRQNQYLDTATAQVTLAEIPFVRLRHTLPSRLLGERTSFGEAVRWSNLDTIRRSLVIDLRAGTLTASGESVPMERKELAFYAAFARGAKDGEPAFEISEKHSVPLARAFAEELARSRGMDPEAQPDLNALFEALADSDLDPRTLGSVRNGVTRSYVAPLASNIKSTLEDALGTRVAQDYRINLLGNIKSSTGRVTLYGLDLTANQITFI